jgi:hypothetical protein
MQLPASFSVLALRTWWPVVFMLSVLGAAFGVYAASSVSYSATALLRVDVSTNPVQSQQIVSTAFQLVDSDPVYTLVVGDSRNAVNELRSRTTVGIRDAGAVLFVTVVAPTAEQAERDTDGFADAAVGFARQLAQEQFATVTRLGAASLKEGVLPDPEAEANRRDRVGTNLADGQDYALRQERFVTRLGGVQTPQPLGVSTTLAAPLGAAGGALLGFVAALGLGVRRRHVRYIADLRPVLPGVRAFTADNQRDGLLRIAARSATLHEPLVAVVAMRTAEQALAGVVEDLQDLLRAEQMTWTDVDADDLAASPDRAARLKPLALETYPSPARRHLTLVTGTADPSTVPQIAARADLIVLVVPLHRARLGEVAALYDELRDSSPILVLTKPPRRTSGPSAPAGDKAGGGNLNGQTDHHHVDNAFHPPSNGSHAWPNSSRKRDEDAGNTVPPFQ